MTVLLSSRTWFSRPERSQPERTRREDRHSKFYEIPDNLIETRREVYPLSSETSAEVHAGGQIVQEGNRKTLTRVATMGVFATQKKGKTHDKRQLTLVVEDPQWNFVWSYLPATEPQVRSYAAQINAASRALTLPPMHAPAPPVAPPPTFAQGHNTILDQIRQLGQLRAQGLLTDAEFESKKADLLDRL